MIYTHKQTMLFKLPYAFLIENKLSFSSMKILLHQLSRKKKRAVCFSVNSIQAYDYWYIVHAFKLSSTQTINHYISR